MSDMSVFNLSGNDLRSVYRLSGSALTKAYDITGDAVYPPDSPGPSLSVMAYNVGCFYSEWHPAPTSTGTVFYQRQQTIFDKYDLAFAGLSEWYNQIGTVQASVLMDEYFPAWHPDYTPYPGNANAALTSGFSQAPESVTLVRYSTQGSEPRYYQKSYVTLGEKRICCILTHLDLNASTRAEQFLEVLNAVQNEKYFILLGDFNFQIAATGDNEYNASVQVALNRGYHSAQNADGLFMTWYSGETAEESANTYALDNIITSANINIESVSVDTTKLTDGLCAEYGIIIDHLPLIAELTIH